MNDKVKEELICVDAFNDKELKMIFNLDFSTDSDDIQFVIPSDSKYIILDKEDLKNILFQISDIISLNSKNREERGITIKKNVDSKIEVICPSGMHYFKTNIKTENNLDVADILYFDYLFLEKILKHLSSKIIIYTKDEVKENEVVTNYYLRVNKSDLILPYINLSKEEISRIDVNYKILNNIMVLNSRELLPKLLIMYKYVLWDVGAEQKMLCIYNGVAVTHLYTFTAYTKINLPDFKIRINVIKYLIKACKLAQDKKILLMPIQSDILRYAIKYGNTSMIFTCLPTTKEHRCLKEIKDKPILSVMDIYNLKRRLEIKQLLYSEPNIFLEFVSENFQIKYMLINKSLKIYKIDTRDKLYYSKDVKIRINSANLLKILETLDSKRLTRIGYRNDYLFIENSNVTVVLKNLDNNLL